MPAYWIGRVKVNDTDQYKKYADQSPVILAKHGGKGTGTRWSFPNHGRAREI